MTKSKVAERLAALIKTCGKSQKVIAEELGYPHPNIITMFKQGKTKIPINKAGPLAKAVGADPAHFVRLAMQEYMPDALAAVEEHLGVMLSANERRLIEAYREATNGMNPQIGPSDMASFRAWAGSIVVR